VVIRWYGILMALSIVVALWLCHRQARREKLPADDIISVAQWAILAGLVGARLYEVIFNWDYYGAYPRKILAVWEAASPSTEVSSWDRWSAWSSRGTGACRSSEAST
jgi:prolipoprotein diacylglyceryltransferase